MTIYRTCASCGRPCQGSYCERHEPKPWATSQRKSRVGLSGSSEQARSKRILKRDGWICHVCGRGGAGQVDHVIPLFEGGDDSDDNLAAIHSEPCHREKTQAEARRARA